MEGRIKILTKYLDASLVVSLLAYEDTTLRANIWLDQQQPGSMASSVWLETEVSSAFSRKIRTGRLSPVERDIALGRFRTDVLRGLTILHMDRAVFQMATTICQRHDLGIRAGDALHLAAAVTSSLTICTFDKAFAAGASSLGYPVELIA